jgi:uncharacterized protein (TIGR02996 family)
MTTQHEALYRAICAHPNEDTPRLAYADLIDEEGECEQAKFIRAQIAIAGLPEYDPLFVSTQQLDPDVIHGWMMSDTLPQVPAGYTWRKYEFWRGFPWKVGVDSPLAFAGDGGRVFEIVPVQALEVHEHRPDMVTLANWQHLSRIRRLEFSVGRFGVEAASLLGDSQHATNLTELAFEFDGITAEGLETLAKSALFPRLTALELHLNVIPPALMVDALAAAREPVLLGRLSLKYNRITQYDAAHLFALPVMQGLEYLDLSENRLEVEGIQSLAESVALRGLRVLKLSKTLPGVPGVQALLKTGRFTGVRSLDLSANRLGPTAVKLIAESGTARGLRVLNLANNSVGDAGATALANSRTLSGLLELDLANAELTDAGALAIAESPYLGNLLRLNLVGTRPFGETAKEALVERFGQKVSV